MLRLLTVLVFAALAFSPARAATAHEQAAMAATQAACDAIRLRDLAALERLLAPEFKLVGTNGEVQTRAQTFEEVRAGDPQYERFDNHSMTARVYGNTAVVQGVTSLKGRSGSTPFVLDVRFTDTLVRSKGKWSIVVSHVTKIPTAPAPVAQANPPAPAKEAQPIAPVRDGQHDFDFEIGTWKTHLRRLQKPLTGSTTWVEYEGTSVVRSIWNGRANLVELDVKGPAGRIEGMSLRLYNAKTGQWSLNFSGLGSGSLAEPSVGQFRNGRGEFFNRETYNGKEILVRFVISDITPTSCRFEQAFSADGGKTWEVNWIATDTRV